MLFVGPLYYVIVYAYNNSFTIFIGNVPVPSQEFNYLFVPHQAICLINNKITVANISQNTYVTCIYFCEEFLRIHNIKEP